MNVLTISCFFLLFILFSFAAVICRCLPLFVVVCHCLLFVLYMFRCAFVSTLQWYWFLSQISVRIERCILVLIQRRACAYHNDVVRTRLAKDFKAVPMASCRSCVRESIANTVRQFFNFWYRYFFFDQQINSKHLYLTFIYSTVFVLLSFLFFLFFKCNLAGGSCLEPIE